MTMETNRTFSLPLHLHAPEPPEARGLRRDQVRLMVNDKQTGAVKHDSFSCLDHYLKTGDLLVLNNSRTIPASLSAVLLNGVSAAKAGLRLARKTGAYTWEVLIEADTPSIGDRIVFKDRLEADIIGTVSGSPLHEIKFHANKEVVLDYIMRHGEPVRYEYTDKPWGLDFYQTVFASVPGSVEMPSAGRAFSWEMLIRLQRKGVKLAFLQLHTGLSYTTEEYWPPNPKSNLEWYHVPEQTLDTIQETKAAGKKVIAVGTTVVRALETVAQTNERSGITNLYIGPGHHVKMADGIMTGFHEPEASHLDLLSCFIREEQLLESYRTAIASGYLWHEFGDMNLIL